MSSFGRQYLPQERAEATGQGPQPSDLPPGSLKIRETIGPDCVLIPPRSAPAYLHGADGYNHRRRNCLVRINSTKLVHRRGGSSEQRPVPTFGTVFHYASVYIYGRPKTLAYVEHVKSAKDRPGRYGYASTKFGIECISGCEETRYYVPVRALAELVGTMER